MRVRNGFRGVFLGIAGAVALAVLPAVSSAAVFVGLSVNIAPPAIPLYVQPPLPAPGYLWVPGYWAWGPAGYYWVPGTWVEPPAVGLLWTPGYWGWANGAYLWHAGYWGPHIGFYGGVNYGFGYGGVGFAGGYWRGGAFFYNRAVANVASVHVTNVYYRTVINNVSVTRVSYNGGPGGVAARPTRMELAAAHERHIASTPLQRQHIQFAARDHALLASANGGRPPVAATMRPGQFSGRGVVAARAGGAPGRFGAERGQRYERPEQAQRFNRPQARQFNRPERAPSERPQAQRFARPQAHPHREQAPGRGGGARDAGREARGAERDRPR
jgi:hypothetical protein